MSLNNAFFSVVKCELQQSYRPPETKHESAQGDKSLPAFEHDVVLTLQVGADRRMVGSDGPTPYKALYQAFASALCKEAGEVPLPDKQKTKIADLATMLPEVSRRFENYCRQRKMAHTNAPVPG